MRYVFVFLAIFLIPCNVLSDEVSDIEEAYKGLKDIKGSFTQKSYIKDLKKTLTYKGTFAIKFPSMMRFGYDGSDVIINGKEIVIIQKAERQAFTGRFDPSLYGQTPIALLGGFAKIKDEFNISIKDKKLLLKPKHKMAEIVSIEITLVEGNFPIGSLKIIDSYSNTIEIELEKIKTNSAIARSYFDIKIPEGFHTYEYNP